ncbi:hypothetical protein GUITHDRAFT_122998 [Guillardia theta CCMP2712]|uniref:Sphingomyelin synthase-like domain-containing protein n=1 Tax=Guillardia theta (strain CCMP2712) TaxID=905079 RepID=L1I3J6_GUITC|nr:hypothetical protein GUITHDRAFT_122998 [Guillardia theta CCMP2712]EKX30788.1 hypothetical protein GUITHDRAFT_122998 [Guillardia theta CCMP2712]|eukprot:XP_005817768.1 hypothetical protein GUITHDRAFT_122998 [Guillardia theta CCMP2712]
MESTSQDFACAHRWVPTNETVYRLSPRLRWILLYWFVSIIFMDYINTFGYDRVPMNSPPLPDIGFDAIAKVSGSEAPVSLPFNPTDFATICICASVILLSIYEWRTCRNRKLKHLFAIYAILMNMRTVTIISTTLPIPYTKGPCRDDHRPITNRFLTGLGYAFALGFKQFLSTPQCGDLIFSGHTTFMWIFTLHLLRHASILTTVGIKRRRVYP